MGSTSEYQEIVGLNRGGVFRRGAMRHVLPDTRTQALRKLHEDRAAWVRPEDAQPVLEAWQAEVQHAATLPAWAQDGP